ncbi:hypothetical protein THAOC_03359, partial [Thalassiosira oceanica]
MKLGLALLALSGSTSAFSTVGQT